VSLKYGAFLDADRAAGDGGESFDLRPENNRRIGTLSAIMLIANRVIGTGIFG
jgi:hypothetical protein